MSFIYLQFLSSVHSDGVRPIVIQSGLHKFLMTVLFHVIRKQHIITYSRFKDSLNPLGRQKERVRKRKEKNK